MNQKKYIPATVAELYELLEARRRRQHRIAMIVGIVLAALFWTALIYSWVRPD